MLLQSWPQRGAGLFVSVSGWGRRVPAECLSVKKMQLHGIKLECGFHVER